MDAQQLSRSMHRHEQLPKSEEELGRDLDVHVLQQWDMLKEGRPCTQVEVSYRAKLPSGRPSQGPIRQG